jgi:hypothetical protein
MAEKRRSWSKPPIDPEDDEDGDPAATAGRALGGAKDRVVALSGRVAAGVAPVADKLGAGVRAGLGKVGEALRDDAAAAVPAELLAQAELPELSTGDALLSLAARLDREADFWRLVAMRQLARAAWTERLGLSASIALLIGALVLAAVAGFRALFATGGGAGTAMLVAVGLGALLVAALVVSFVSARVRGGQAAAQREALLRADLAEARLHRIGLLLTLRERDPEAFVAAIRELEHDVRAAG